MRIFNLLSMTIQERLLYLLDKLYSGSKTKFAKAIGVHPQTFINTINRGSNPSLPLIQKILDNHPTVNPVWFVMGRGEPFDVIKNGNGEKNKSIDSGVKHKIEMLEKEIELLRSSLEDKEEVIAAKNLLIDHLQKMMG